MLVAEISGSNDTALVGSLRETHVMSDAARKLLQDVLALPEDKRLALDSEIIASVDGPRDADWDATCWQS